jgi:NAD(P)-dependent dehydrogenase (short-subunit alcohol dehydrogenase family)
MRIFLFAAVFVAIGIFGANESYADGHAQKAVLVTGASSGIGRNITERLAGNGYFVYATARKDKDLEALNALENVQAIRLDVTSQDDVDAAVAAVKAGGRGLHGVVNNAGVASSGSMTQIPESDIDFVFGVNIYGPYRVTKAFAPMIIENQGRITTIGSIAGFIARDTSGVYAMSKFSMEAFTDALADELEPQGVKVSIVEPGAFNSKIWRTTAERTLTNMQAAGMDVSDDVRERVQGAITYGEGQPDPDEVAAAVEHAMFADAPKRRYMVTPNEGQAKTTLQHAIRRVAELNHDQQYSLDREQLIELLDEALGAL